MAPATTVRQLRQRDRADGSLRLSLSIAEGSLI
jgi:hypothetical protein